VKTPPVRNQAIVLDRNPSTNNRTIRRLPKESGSVVFPRLGGNLVSCLGDEFGVCGGLPYLYEDIFIKRHIPHKKHLLPHNRRPIRRQNLLMNPPPISIQKSVRCTKRNPGDRVESQSRCYYSPPGPKDRHSCSPRRRPSESNYSRARSGGGRRRGWMP
jgi:hypothetical protein